MENEVLYFVSIFNRDPETVDLFTNCACYWFAKILQERFSPSYIVYSPSGIHFATRIDGEIYDITGKVDPDDYGPWFDWESYKKTFPDSDMIERTCVLMSH